MEHGANGENGGHVLPLVFDEYDLTDRQLLEVGCHLFNRLHPGVEIRPPSGRLKLPLSLQAAGGGGLRLDHTTVWKAQQQLGMLRVECDDGTEIEMTATHDARAVRGVLRAVIRARTRARGVRVQRILTDLLRWLGLG